MTVPDDFLTVSEAASILHVSPSTIRRWIREHTLPAYRIGQRHVAIKRSDLPSVVKPARTPLEHDAGTSNTTGNPGRKLTAEERQRALDAMDRLEALAKHIAARHAGEVFPPSWQTLNDLRDERTRQLS